VYLPPKLSVYGAIRDGAPPPGLSLSILLPILLALATSLLPSGRSLPSSALLVLLIHEQHK